MKTPLARQFVLRSLLALVAPSVTPAQAPALPVVDPPPSQPWMMDAAAALTLE